MRFFFFAVAMLGVSSTVEAKPCLADRAVYTMQGAKGFELHLVKAGEPTAYSLLDAQLITPNRKLAFSFTASNGYSFNYLVPRWPDAPADADFHLFAFDRHMNTLGLPQAGQAAPPFLLTPELGSYLWYGSEPREFLPVNVWRLHACK